MMETDGCDVQKCRTIRFILSAIAVEIKLLYLSADPEQTEMQNLNRCDAQSRMVDSQYKKSLTIWELGKNKFI
jgi:hypothetical protein